MKISVCMATYNGTKTIAKQLTSILKQLSANDQVVIIDDCSTDDTVRLVEQLTSHFSGEIILKKNASNQGPIKTFETALGLANGDLILLSDQDDEWFDDKVSRITEVFIKQQADLIVHDAVVIGRQGESIDDSWNHYNQNNVNQTVVGNLIKNGFTGAMMAVSKKLLDDSLPFPDNIEMHDQWLFLVAKKKKLKIAVIEAPLMAYVRHGGNVTGMTKRSINKVLIGRIKMLSNYMKIGR